DDIGFDLVGQSIDSADEPWRGEKYLFPGPLDPERLHPVPVLHPVVRRGQHGERGGVEASPQLPQQGLYPADLGWEVVGDEEMLHRGAVIRTGTAPRTGTVSAIDNSARTRGSESSPARRRASSTHPNRAAVHTAWARNSG